MNHLAERPLNVMIIISSLEFGGAERQVIELMKQYDRQKVNPILCSLSDYNPLANTLPNKGQELLIVRKNWKFDFTTIFRVARLFRKHRIDVVHAFLFDAEITARLAAFISGVPVVIGSERNSDYVMPRIQKIVHSVTKQFMTGLIANSNAGKRYIQAELSLSPESVYVIPNGIDIERFVPDQDAGQAVRTKVGIPLDANVVGMIATFKKQKRHDIFLRMAQQILQASPDSWFVLVGEPLRNNQQGASDYHASIRTLVDELGIAERCLFLGSRSDMVAVYNACDVTVLTSSREGTPNVLLESMGCAVPVVASDIADNANVVQSGKNGYIVPFGDVQGFTDSVLGLLEDKEKAKSFGEQARDWVTEAFSTAVLARKTENVYMVMYEQKTAQKPSHSGK